MAKLSGLDMRQRAELEDRHNAVIEEVRGEGLLIELKLKVPPTSFAEAALKSEASQVIPGDNVVPLCRRFVSDNKMAEKFRGSMRLALR